MNEGVVTFKEKMYSCPACGNLNRSYERGGVEIVPGVEVSCIYCGFVGGKYVRFETERHVVRQIGGVPGQLHGTLVFKDRMLNRSRRVMRMTREMRVRFQVLYGMFHDYPNLAFNTEEVAKALRLEGLRPKYAGEVLDYLKEMGIIRVYMMNDIRYYRYGGKSLKEVTYVAEPTIDESGLVVWEREHGERVEKVVERSGERGVN
jgi:hypothetical protein